MPGGREEARRRNSHVHLHRARAAAEGGRRRAPDPERFVFVRDGFSFWAFLLAPLWMLRHRLWLVLIGYVIVTVALQVGLRLIGASATVIMLASASCWRCWSASRRRRLRRFTLARRRWRNVGIVVGDDLEDRPSGGSSTPG